MPTQTDRKQTSVRLPLRLRAELEYEAHQRGLTRAEYMRSLLESRHEAARLRERLDAREARIEELEEQLAKRSQIEEKVDTLAKQVDDEPPPWPVRWYRWVRSD